MAKKGEKKVRSKKCVRDCESTVVWTGHESELATVAETEVCIKRYKKRQKREAQQRERIEKRDSHSSNNCNITKNGIDDIVEIAEIKQDGNQVTWRNTRVIFLWC